MGDLIRRVYRQRFARSGFDINHLYCDAGPDIAKEITGKNGGRDV